MTNFLHDEDFTSSQEYIDNHSLQHYMETSPDAYILSPDMKWDEYAEMDMRRSEQVYDAWQNHQNEKMGVTVDTMTKDVYLLKLFDTVIDESIQENVNNIAINEYRDFGVIRFAYGQHWLNYRLIQKSSVQPLITIIKRKAGLDYQIDNRNKQQTQGRIKINDTFFRTYTGRDFFGDYANLRLLDSSIIPWEKLNLPEQISDRLQRRVLKQNSKMLIVGGPTGSGKSTTLNAIMEYIVRKSQGTLNLYSVEDPIEVALSGVIQIEADAEHGPTYAQILKGISRGQPNIIRINEISDDDTAKAALVAASKGVTSMATAHINSTVDTFEVFKQFGVAENDIKNSLGEILYMHRPPRLCPHCKIKKSYALNVDRFNWIARVLADGHKELMNGIEYYRNPEGCEICRAATADKSLYGYLGNISVYEYLEVNRPMLRIWRKFKEYDSYVLKEKLMHPDTIEWDDTEDTVQSDMDADGKINGIIYDNIELDLLAKLNEGELDLDTIANIVNE